MIRALRLLRPVTASLVVAAAAGCQPSVRSGASGASPESSVTATAAVEPEVHPADATQVLAAARAPGAQVTLVNVWATWCGPCRQEFPELVRFEREYRDRGVRVVLVSTDFESELPNVRRFLAAQGVDRPSWIKHGDDQSFIDGIDKRWTGALPASFVFDASGRVRNFWEGAVDYRTFEKEVTKVLDEKPAS